MNIFTFWIGKIIGNIVLSEKEGEEANISWAIVFLKHDMIGTDLPTRSKLEGICPINSFHPRRPHKCEGAFQEGLEAILP